MGICNVTDNSKRHKCHTHIEEGKKGYLENYRFYQLNFHPQDDWPCKQMENNGCDLL